MHLVSFNCDAFCSHYTPIVKRCIYCNLLFDCDDHYECIGVCIDDLVAVGSKPMEIINDLKKISKVKGVGLATFLLP